MTNPPDVDQSGNPLPREPTYLGPSVGWVLQYSPLGLPDVKYYTYYAPTIAGAVAVLGAGTLYIPGTDDPVLPATYSGITLSYDGPAIPLGASIVAGRFADKLLRSQLPIDGGVLNASSGIEFTAVPGTGGTPRGVSTGHDIVGSKLNWSSVNRETLPQGDIAGISIILRNAGPTVDISGGSDTAALGYNVVLVGEAGFATGFEGVTYSANDDFSARKGINIQCGSTNYRTDGDTATGFSIASLVGSCDVGLKILEAGGTFAEAIGIAGGGSIYMDGAIWLGAATGGRPIAGGINAKVVMDDGVVLTCMPLSEEFLRTGTIDLAYWDNLVPDDVFPAYMTKEHAKDEKGRLLPDNFEPVFREVGPKIFDEPILDKSGNPIKDVNGNIKTRKRGYLEGVNVFQAPTIVDKEVPEKTTPRIHKTAHLFKAMLDEGFDPRDPAQYVAKVKRDAALPGMPSQSEWQHGTLGLGDIFSRLWLASEMLALVIIKQQERLDAIEAKLGI